MIARLFKSWFGQPEPDPYFEEDPWSRSCRENAARLEREKSEGERRDRLTPDLLVKLESHFKDKPLSDGTFIKFKLDVSPFGDRCVIAHSPAGLVWVSNAEFHRPNLTGYYVFFGRGGGCRVGESGLFAKVAEKLAC